jgi:hypothetical protein
MLVDNVILSNKKAASLPLVDLISLVTNEYRYISIITGKITGRRSMVFLQKRRRA